MAEDTGETGGTTGGGNETESVPAIFSRSVHTSAGMHQTIAESIEDNAVYSVWNLTWEGNYDTCKATRDAHYCGELVTGDATFIRNPAEISNHPYDIVISGMSLRRTAGNRGTVTFVVKAFHRGYEGNIDFERIDKDIHTWRQSCKQNVPDLSIIMCWEKEKELGNIDRYKNYKYVDAEGNEKTIEENTPERCLAEMIYRGVESYPYFVPVLNVTITFAKHPVELNIEGGAKCGALLGHEVSSSDILPNGFSIPYGAISGGTSPLQDFEALQGDIIICNSDRLQCNSDGSYTLTRTFAKFWDYEKELYIGASGQKFGPADPEASGSN